MRPVGIDITEATFLETFGQRNDAILPQWLGARSTPRLVAELADAKESLYRAFVAEAGLVPLPGALDWLRRLQADGWRQAIASSAPRRNVDVMVDALGIGALIEATVAAEDVRHGKPAPDVFLAAAAALEVSADRCVVVEDAPAGIEAARRAAMRIIGTGPGATRGADLRVPSLDRLPAGAFDAMVPAS